MKALRLELYQQTACYKKPLAFKVSETYPLPPHSTIKGMLHTILDASELIPMRISVQGEYDTMVTDYQTHYFFKSNQTNEFVLTLDGLEIEYEFKEIGSMPIYMHMLYDVNLLIHIDAAPDILSELKWRIERSPMHFSLGRWEDLVRVDRCEIVNLEEAKEDFLLRHHAFVPEQLLNRRNSYFSYQLSWTYRVMQGVRVWDKLKMGYVQKNGLNAISHKQPFWIDNEGDGVFFSDISVKPE